MHIKLNQILNLVHKHSVDSLVAAACYKVQLFVREQSCCPPPTHGAGKASQPRVWASFVKQRPPLLHKNGWKIKQKISWKNFEALLKIAMAIVVTEQEIQKLDIGIVRNNVTENIESV